VKYFLMQAHAFGARTEAAAINCSNPTSPEQMRV
jgi:hypothetical protein